MITDPLEEWRRLKEHYGRLRGEELQSLLEESSQLTDLAKETLRAEIFSRGLRVQVRDTPRLSRTTLTPLTWIWLW